MQMVKPLVLGLLTFILLSCASTNPSATRNEGPGLQEQEARKPKVEITFNGLSQKELQAKFPLPLVLEPTLTTTLSFVVSNVGDGPVLRPLITYLVDPTDVSVDRPGPSVHETRPNHYRYQVRGVSILPIEIYGGRYEYTAAVKVPEGIGTFRLHFKIFGDNLPHEDLLLVFQAIHPKRPGSS